MKKLLIFKSKDCGPCKVQEKIMEKAKLNIDIEYIDAFNNPEIAHRHKVFCTPTLILFENGEESKRSIETVADIKEFVGGN